MTGRTKWLMLAGLAVFVLYSADNLYRTWIETPTTELDAQLDGLTRKLQDTQEKQLVAQKVGKRLDGYAQRALPADALLARSLYQQYVLELVADHQWTSTSVDAAQPLPIELRSRTKKGKKMRVGHRISYALHGQATLTNLAALLNEFRQAPHLHKIKSLALNPIGSEGKLDINVNIEVLCLECSVNDQELSQLKSAETSEQPVAGDDHLVRRNLFARGFAKALFDIELKAITFNREGQAEAWFTVDSRGTTKRVCQGNQIPVALHDIALVEILADKALVRVNQESHWVSLGQTLGEVCSALPANPPQLQ